MYMHIYKRSGFDSIDVGGETVNTSVRI